MKKKYNCLQCGIECTKKPQSTGKFCGNPCQKEYQYYNVTKPSIEQGTCLNPSTLKKYIKRELGDICFECGLGPVWNGKVLSLQLDHIDGNSDNCVPDNLRLLCPNCHTQTETYGNKGGGNRYKKVTKRNSYIRQYRGSEQKSG